MHGIVPVLFKSSENFLQLARTGYVGMASAIGFAELGHRVTGYQHDVTLEVGGNRFHEVPIAFTRDMPDNAVNILGQQGFFEIFPIKFTYRIKEIDLVMGVLR